MPLTERASVLLEMLLMGDYGLVGTPTGLIFTVNIKVI